MNMYAEFKAYPFDSDGIKSKVTGRVTFTVDRVMARSALIDRACEIIRKDFPNLVSTPIDFTHIGVDFEKFMQENENV